MGPSDREERRYIDKLLPRTLEINAQGTMSCSCGNRRLGR